MKKIKKSIFIFFRPMLHIFCRFFFEQKYLSGRHFETDYYGYIWALRSIWTRSILRLAPPMPCPVALSCHVSNFKNIVIHPDNIDNFQSPGTYFQNFKGMIHIGYGTCIAPNVGLITANHKIDNLIEHEDGRDIKIGEKCWIGMNSVILPGVHLGNHTIVAAGSVVTKSFPEGKVVVGGVPAKILKTLP